jgi:hypothetical protein
MRRSVRDVSKDSGYTAIKAGRKETTFKNGQHGINSFCCSIGRAKPFRHEVCPLTEEINDH